MTRGILIALGVATMAMTGCKGQNRTVGTPASSSSNNNGGGGGSGGMIVPATFTTAAKTIGTLTLSTGTLANPKSLSWNLGGADLSGATPVPGAMVPVFKINIYAFTPQAGAKTTYVISAPTVVGGTSALHVQSVGVIINGNVITDATTYLTADRYIPAYATTPANYANGRVLSTTNLVIDMVPSSNDTIAFTFGTIAPTTFAPPTYTTLKTTGIIGTTCQSCHNANNKNGGIDLTSYPSIISNYVAVPFQPANSLMYERMTNSLGTGYMPPGNPQPTSVVQTVYDWILDGAPNN